MRIGSVFNRLAGKFSDIPNKKPKGKKGLETGACYWLVKVTLTNENRAYLIWRHHGGNTIVNGCKTVQVDGKGVYQCVGIFYTSLAVDYHFQGAGTHRKNVAMSSRACIIHSEEPRMTERGLQLLNETEYSFGNPHQKLLSTSTLSFEIRFWEDKSLINKHIYGYRLIIGGTRSTSCAIWCFDFYFKMLHDGWKTIVTNGIIDNINNQHLNCWDWLISICIKIWLSLTVIFLTKC